jgi:hypothetical protein
MRRRARRLRNMRAPLARVTAPWPTLRHLFEENERAPSVTRSSRTRSFFTFPNDLRKLRHCMRSAWLCHSDDVGYLSIVEGQMFHRRAYWPELIEDLCCGRHLPVKVPTCNMHVESINPGPFEGI